VPRWASRAERGCRRDRGIAGGPGGGREKSTSAAGHRATSGP
jgi:hypothetical protein